MGYQCPHLAIEGKQFGRDFSLVGRIWSPMEVMLPFGGLVGTILQMSQIKPQDDDFRNCME